VLGLITGIRLAYVVNSFWVLENAARKQWHLKDRDIGTLYGRSTEIRLYAVYVPGTRKFLHGRRSKRAIILSRAPECYLAAVQCMTVPLRYCCMHEGSWVSALR
jgi:hypothetical protein